MPWSTTDLKQDLRSNLASSVFKLSGRKSCLDAEIEMFGWDRVEIESSTVWVSRRIRYLSDAESEMHEAELSLQEADRSLQVSEKQISLCNV